MEDRVPLYAPGPVGGETGAGANPARDLVRTRPTVGCVAHNHEVPGSTPGSAIEWRVMKKKHSSSIIARHGAQDAIAGFSLEITQKDELWFTWNRGDKDSIPHMETRWNWIAGRSDLRKKPHSIFEIRKPRRFATGLQRLSHAETGRGRRPCVRKGIRDQGLQIHLLCRRREARVSHAEKKKRLGPLV